MKKPVIIIGMGELGELFAQGFLKLGFPVVPVLRSTSTASLAREIPEPELVLVAVGEDDLQSVLDQLPENWGKDLALLQNELMPRDWTRHSLPQPHVVVVWFDKKKGRPCVSVLPTLVAGPKAKLIVSALTRIDVPCRAIPETEVLFEMIRKNLYILTINIAGLRTGGTVSQLWDQHRSLAQAVASEILDIQEWLAGETLPRERLLNGMLQGFDGDPNHICTGRSAPVRMRRALQIAREAGIDTPTLDAIARDIEQASGSAPC
jgi:ketopantoate reductase